MVDAGANSIVILTQVTSPLKTQVSQPNTKAGADLNDYCLTMGFSLNPNPQRK